jgi:hypothetical protein
MIAQNPQSTLESLKQLLALPYVEAGLSIALGCAYCLLGYRIFRVLLVLWGVVTGGALGWVLGGQYGGTGVALAAAAVGALAMAAVAVMLFLLGVFLFGAAMGGAAGLAIASATGHAGRPYTLSEGSSLPPMAREVVAAVPIDAIGLGILAISALMGGVLAVVLRRSVVILATSVLGGAMIAAGGLWLYLLSRGVDLRQIREASQLEPYRTQVLLAAAAWVIFAVLGAAVQVRGTGRRGRLSAERPQA